MEYYCNICNKIYVSYKSLWNHNNKFHKVEISQLLAKPAIDVSQKLAKNKLKCIFCDNIYKHRSSKSKHEKKCKEKNKNEIIEIKNELNELKKIIKNNKLTKNTNNGSINNGTINNGNITNGNITNNIHINALGTENIIEKLTEKEKLDLLTDILFKEIPHVELVRKIFNNEKFVEDRNTIISNLQTKTCFAYNDENNKFEAKNKNEHIDNMIYYRHKDIRNIYKEMYDNKKIKDNSRKLIEEYIEKFDNLKNTESYKKHKEEIIYIIYNCKELMKKLKDDIEFDV